MSEQRHRVSFYAEPGWLVAECECGWQHKWAPASRIDSADYAILLGYGLEHVEQFTDRPTRSEQSLEGAAVNGLTPVGEKGSSE